jgi:hypothetical protein
MDSESRDRIVGCLRHQEDEIMFEQQHISTADERCDRGAKAVVEKSWSPGG